MKKAFVVLSLATLFAACGGSDGDTEYTPPVTNPETEGTAIGSADVWMTTASKSKLLSQQADAVIYDNATTTAATTTIDFSQQFQEIDGFGAALTGSSAYVINHMNAAQKDALLKDLFSPEDGIGLSYLRLTIGASDFSLGDFSYDDMPAGQTDPSLANFSIADDETDVVPVMQGILGYSPNIKILGSPWSAPAWMKGSGTMRGGSLDPQYYSAYADYFVKYINAYAAHGINITAVTPQNEPLHDTNGYPSLKMTSGEQADFIKNHLGPKVTALGTKIFAYDHNFDVPSYPLDVLNDAAANQYVDGSAFHAYAGDVSAMNQVHAAFPNKNLYFTEISGGEWSADFGSNLKWLTSTIFMGTTRNWSKNVLLWNLALNPNHGPTNGTGGCTNCRGVVTIDGSGQVTKNEEYYALAHFSKFVKPGAKRVSSTEFNSSTGLKNVAFINPDGSRVLVVLNESATSQKFSAIIGTTKLNYTVEANAVATFVWK